MKTRRLGAACDFRIVGLESDRLMDWILEQRLPFNSLYFYGSDRSIYVSYDGDQHKRKIWTFSESSPPTRQGIELWLKSCKRVIC
jgi:hypothetical protein